MNVLFELANSILTIREVDGTTGARQSTLLNPGWNYFIEQPDPTLPTNYTISIVNSGVTVGTWQYADFVTYTGFFGHLPPDYLNLTQNLFDVMSIGDGNPPAPPITSLPASMQIAVTRSVLLHNALSGGVWSTSDAGVIDVNSTTGLITGIAPGNASISYQPQGSYSPATTDLITVTP